MAAVLDVLEVIVTDGLWRKSLSAVRSLGKAGYDVCVFGDSVFTTSFWSRYACHRVICRSAKDDASAFGRALLKYLQSRKGTERPVLFPMEDATLEWVSANRAELFAYADFLLPSAESLSMTQSKAATIRFASSLGLPVPETIEVSDSLALAAAIQLMRETGTLRNYIVKPVSGSGSAGIVYLDEQELPDWDAHWSKFGPLVIQKRIARHGQGLGVSVLFDQQGECVATFAHARLQEYPNTGGPSTARVSILDDALVEQSVRLLKALNWRGVAMVEWKRDTDDGVPKLLEVNPRFWGSLELAVRSGVNFPLLYAQAATGKDIDLCSTYQLGVVCRWILPGEILRYLTQPKENRESFLEFLRGLPAAAEEWDLKDVPGIFAALLCPAISALNPKYWKYLTR